MYESEVNKKTDSKKMFKPAPKQKSYRMSNIEDLTNNL